ncbi:MAG: hypothetical protein F9K24_10065 [Leptonema illini]|uniref:Uncharacterized protein n=1 Tax=Leptonema illini TaxID=183 RepID=A0A833LYV7_9LEPT|nr:MAG: hypothetical protein F9K24_10065 [Leptonema illini]
MHIPDQLPSASATILSGGHLHEVMAGCMLSPEHRRRFLRLAALGISPPEYASRFERLYGWQAPDEILEYERCRLAYADALDRIPDTYSFIDVDSEDDAAFADELAAHPQLAGEGIAFDYLPPSARWLIEEGDVERLLDRLLSSYAGTMFLFTGLIYLGSDPSGDSCWIGLLPDKTSGKTKAVTVHPYNHETGELEGDVYFSLAHFIASFWGSVSADEYEEDFDEDPDEDLKVDAEDDAGESGDGTTGGEPRIAETPVGPEGLYISEEIVEAFSEKAAGQYEKRPEILRPEELFERAHWLLGHSYDDPTYAFAEHIDSAPTVADWQQEKKLLRKHPHLAFYWIIAHYFMKNDQACKEACEIAMTLSGEVAKALAHRMLKQLKTEQSLFPAITSADRLSKLRENTRKNCSDAQLEASQEQATSAEQSKATNRLTEKQCQSRLASGEDPFAIIAAFPDDVATHDLCLETAAKNDAEFAKQAKQYFSERADSYYNTWPYDSDRLDRRFSLPCSAAFRSGLRYNAEHKKAFCGITKTLGMLDDDAAMLAFAEAIDRLEQDDDRFEPVLESLAESNHARKAELLHRAARRFLGSRSEALEKQKRIEAKGPTLDAMFMQNSKLRPALSYALHLEDEESERLVDIVLASRENLAILGLGLGDAFRVVRRRGLNRHLSFVHDYLKTVEQASEKIGSFEFRVLYNAAEAAITFAGLVPEDAVPFLKGLFQTALGLTNAGAKIDLIASALSGLLLHQLEDEHRQWLLRILGNRNGEYRVYGPLAALAGLDVSQLPADWPAADIKASVYHHVYFDPKPMVDYTPMYIEAAARDAYENLTEEALPPFDDSDQYANRIPEDHLIKAIAHPERYSIQHVFERMAEAQLRSHDLIAPAGAWLLESLRFSADEFRYDQGYDRWNCLRALVLQAEASIPVLAACLDLPYIKKDWYVYLFMVMRLCLNEAKARAEYAAMPAEELFRRLENPATVDLPALDILAAAAIARSGAQALQPGLSALRRRLQYLNDQYPHYSDHDYVISRLPVILLQLGEEAWRAIEGIYNENPQNEEIKKVLGSALQADITAPATLPPLSEESPLLLVHALSHPSSEGRTLSIKRTEEGLQIEFSLTGFHLHSLLPDAKKTDRANVAVEYEETLCRAVQLEGYAPAAKKGAGQKKRR